MKALEVFRVFLKLGLTSFGGPIAHIGYYREELVARRAWLSERAFADLVALCHFLPGPASSQTGFAIGYHRAGPMGAAAAFIAFTLPSALIMAACALAAQAVEARFDFSILHGLKLAALAVVAQAVRGMQANLCPDWPRRAIALLTLAILLIDPAGAPPAGQIGVIILGGALGGLFLKTSDAAAESGIGGGRLRTPSQKAGRAAAALAVILLILLLWPWPGLADLAAGVGQAGALVFGGGHVVLPLLESATSDWIGRDLFLAGYGAAQALPGPLFSFAAYIGMLAESPAPALFALLCLAAIFGPGFLLLFAALPSWSRLSHWRPARAAMAGVNAAVVGLLAAALVDPLWISGVRDTGDALIALAAFLILASGRLPVWGVVAMTAALGAGRAVWGL